MLEKMTSSSFHRLVEFLKMTGRLKRTSRAGWVEVGIRQPESVADHTFRTSILCMLYADIEGLNLPKLLRMTLIHDLPEAIIGDLTPSKKHIKSKEKENEAIDQILSLLPKRLREKYILVWNEYQDGKTGEAKAVRQLEKLEMALQAKEYEKDRSTSQSLRRFIESAEKAVVWPQLRRLLSYVLEAPQG